jgi:hypothetical protein
MADVPSSQPEDLSSRRASSTGSGLPAISRAIHVSLVFQAAGALLALGSAVLTGPQPGAEWFGGLDLDWIAWLMAGWSFFWLTCCTAVFVALRARAHGVKRLVMSRATLGLVVWLGLGLFGVLHLWFVLFAAGSGRVVFERSATMLLTLLLSAGSQWIAEILAMMGAFRTGRRTGA